MTNTQLHTIFAGWEIDWGSPATPIAEEVAPSMYRIGLLNPVGATEDGNQQFRSWIEGMVFTSLDIDWDIADELWQSRVFLTVDFAAAKCLEDFPSLARYSIYEAIELLGRHECPDAAIPYWHALVAILGGYLKEISANGL